MVRVIDTRMVGTKILADSTKTYAERKITVYYKELCGLSADEKPTGDDLATGSIFTEVDTGTVFFYDEESDWVEQFSFQG